MNKILRINHLKSLWLLLGMIPQISQEEVNSEPEAIGILKLEMTFLSRVRADLLFPGFLHNQKFLHNKWSRNNQK